MLPAFFCVRDRARRTSGLGAADCGEYRQVAGAVAATVIARAMRREGLPPHLLQHLQCQIDCST